MNPQGITLVPSTSSDTDSNLDTLHTAACPENDEKAGIVVVPQEEMAHTAFCSRRLSDLEGSQKECIPAERPTQLDLGLENRPLHFMATLDPSADRTTERRGSKVCHVDTPQCDSVSDHLPSTSSSEWEEQGHLM